MQVINGKECKQDKTNAWINVQNTAKSIRAAQIQTEVQTTMRIAHESHTHRHWKTPQMRSSKILRFVFLRLLECDIFRQKQKRSLIVCARVQAPKDVCDVQMCACIPVLGHVLSLCVSIDQYESQTFEEMKRMEYIFCTWNENLNVNLWCKQMKIDYFFIIWQTHSHTQYPHTQF